MALLHRLRIVFLMPPSVDTKKLHTESIQNISLRGFFIITGKSGENTGNMTTCSAMSNQRSAFSLRKDNYRGPASIIYI